MADQYSRAHTKRIARHPGTIALYDSETETFGAAIDCALVLGVSEREAQDGGFIRIRSATLHVALADILAAGETLPDFINRPRVKLTDCRTEETEEFTLYERHEQAPGYLLIRAGQYER